MINSAGRNIIALTFITALSYVDAARAVEWRDLWQRQDQQAHTLLRSGNTAEAADKFADHNWRGISHYRSGNFEQAVTEFSAAANSQSRYNRGVAEVMGGDYAAAIESFESVLEAQPDHQDAAHNLEIARELAKQQSQADDDNQQSNDQQDSEDQSESPEESGQEESGQDQSGQVQQQSDTGDGSEENAEQRPEQSDEAGSQREQFEQNRESNQGELSDEAAESVTSSESNGDEEAKADLKEAMAGDSQQDQTDPAPEPADASATVPAGQSVSEENQATEQWLRRIPDDPSQLLRNKIKLNHLLEHPNVGDTEEPW